MNHVAFILSLSIAFLFFVNPCAFAQQVAAYDFERIDVPFAGGGSVLPQTQAWGINNKGQIVGFYSGADGFWHGFLYGGGSFSKIDVPYPNGRNTRANGINDGGEIIGTYDNGTGFHGFLYSGGSFSKIDMTTLPCAGSVTVTNTLPYGISNSGQIVGIYGGVSTGLCPHNSYNYSGGFLDLSDIDPGATYLGVTAFGINYGGQIVGGYFFLVPCYSGGPPGCAEYRGFLGAPGNIFNDPNASNFTTFPSGINDKGDIVGRYLGSDVPLGHGFLYSGGAFSNVDVPAAWGALYTEPHGINSNGQIVGYYQDAGGFHGFLATPRCEGTLKVQADGANMLAGFTPKDNNLTLTQLAQQCGLVGFDWIQKITHSDDPSMFYARNIGGAFDPFIVGPVNLNSARTPYNDPPQGGGYTYQNPPDFAYPFYYSPFPLGVGVCQLDYDLGCHILDDKYLTFLDAPADGCLPNGYGTGTADCNYTTEPPGSFLGLTTALVGIKADGTPVDLGMGFTWTSNYNGTTGGVAVRSATVPADGNGTGGVTLTSVQGGIIAPVDAINVLIEIKPPSRAPVLIKPQTPGMITVAVLTTTAFEASTIDPATVRFGPGAAQNVSAALQDINGDGKLDLVLDFASQATGIQCGDTRARLSGKTVTGQSFFGTETILTGGCPGGDTVPPVTTAVLSPLPNAAGWNNTNVTVTLNSADNEPSGTGAKQITYSATGAQNIGSTIVSSGSTTFTVSTEGITTITFFGTDKAGNVETAKALTIQLDKTPPTITSSRTPLPNANGWNNSNVTVAFQCSDSLSGLSAGSPPAPTTFSTEGVGQSVTGTCTDVAGNSASATVGGINIDKTPPTVACSASPNVLWPPDNKLVPINVSVKVSDAPSGPGGFTLVSVTSNEPISDQGDIQGFVTGTASTSGQVRATRLGSGTGRVYTLTYSGSDRAGNTTMCTTTVFVPHDQGQN